MGWATVVAYGATAVLCFVAFNPLPRDGKRTFGLIVTAILAFLMVNKQLDLQSAMTAFGRCLSQSQGWYDERQVVQFLFIIGLLVASAILAVVPFWGMRRQIRSVWLAMLGLVFLLLFVAVRAVGFHHFDALIGFEVHNVRMNWVLELGGIAMIAANAIWLLLFQRRARNLRTGDER